MWSENKRGFYHLILLNKISKEKQNKTKITTVTVVIMIVNTTECNLNQMKACNFHSRLIK